jgi:hypothetical protein
MHKKDNYVPEPGARYEADDLKMKPLIRAVAFFFFFTAASIVVTIGLFEWLVPGGFASTFQPKEMKRRLPPQGVPLLQTNVSVRTDIANLTKREQTAINSYSWVNRNAGVAHVPIDRAIDIAAQDGLPKWAASAGQGVQAK